MWTAYLLGLGVVFFVLSIIAVLFNLQEKVEGNEAYDRIIGMPLTGVIVFTVVFFLLILLKTH